jgi:hypothetical protein
MKLIYVACLFGMIFAAVGRAEDANFTRAISPEDFKAAGLDHLTPEQIRQLDELVLNFKSGQIAAARHSVQEAIKAKQVAEAQAKAAQSEAKSAHAEVIESKQSTQGFFAKAKVMLAPGTRIEYAEITSTIVGSFEGWQGRAIFTLANGQRWQVANGDEHYFTPPKENVVVEIRQAALGGFWMYFPGLDARVRVKLLSDK